MRPVSHQLLLALPAMLAVLLLVLFATPLTLGHVALVPNVAWVMSLVVAVAYPPAWPRGFAFLLGLAQDVLFGTPLGAQALLTLLLVELVHSQARRHYYQQFRIRWLEASGTLLLWHLLLWAVLQFTSRSTAPPLKPLLIAAAVSAAWYPLFYWIVAKLTGLLPILKESRPRN